ncbi:hypothetical protein Dimus_024433 [Dionaea muscipula]
MWTDVADVGEKESASEENVDATQESKAIAAKEKSKHRIQRKRRRDVISPGVGENLVNEDVEDKEEGGLEVRKRRRLKKAASEEEVAAEDSEKTQSDEDVQGLASDSDVHREGRTKKKHQKQVARTGPSKRPRKSKSPLASEVVGEEEEEKEEEFREENPSDRTVGSDGGIDREETDGEEGEKDQDNEEGEGDEDDIVQREGKGTIVEDDEKEEKEDEDVSSEEVMGKRSPTRKLHLGVLSKHRLRMPNNKMMKRYADTLLGVIQSWGEDDIGYDSSSSRIGFDDKEHC